MVQFVLETPAFKPEHILLDPASFRILVSYRDLFRSLYCTLFFWKTQATFHHNRGISASAQDFWIEAILGATIDAHNEQSHIQSDLVGSEPYAIPVDHELPHLLA